MNKKHKTERRKYTVQFYRKNYLSFLTALISTLTTAHFIILRKRAFQHLVLRTPQITYLRFPMMQLLLKMVIWKCSLASWLTASC